MSKAFKLLGLLFLPVALIVLVFALFYNRTGRTGKNNFLREFDEQNIYG